MLLTSPCSAGLSGYTGELPGVCSPIPVPAGPQGRASSTASPGGGSPAEKVGQQHAQRRGMFKGVRCVCGAISQA